MQSLQLDAEVDQVRQLL
jgi:hypothetical protein